MREGDALLLSPPAPNLSQLASQSARDPPLAPENLAGDPNGEFAPRLVCSPHTNLAKKDHGSTVRRRRVVRGAVHSGKK